MESFVHLTAHARYPIDNWVRQGQPCITTTGWIKLCMKISQNDYDNLKTVFQVADKELSTS
eukprot:7177761-Prorocentrum_lima.AAC.1